MRLAFVVVTYFAERYVVPLLDTLRANTDLTDTVVVVVENASTDGTRALLQAQQETWQDRTGGQLLVLLQDRNTGFAEGCNIGLAEARRHAPYAMLLNQDLELSPGWLPPLLAVMDARPEIAAAQPVIVLHDAPERLNTAGNAIHFCGFGFCDRYRAPVAEVMPDPSEVRAVPYASGAALLLRLSALDRAGAFDERFFLYHEDCDLQIRLRQAGFEAVVVAASRVAHKYDAGFSPRKMAYLERNRWFLLLKDWPLSRLLAAAPALLGTELAVLALAAKGGWLPAKLKTYGEIARALPDVLADRRAVQARRSPAASDGDYLTGALTFEGFDHPLVTKVANPVLSRYWSFVHRILGVA